MKSKDVWKQKAPFLKIIDSIGIVISMAIIVLSILQIAEVWNNAINLFEPLLGVLMLIQAAKNWRTNKLITCVFLTTAMCIFIVTIIILF